MRSGAVRQENKIIESIKELSGILLGILFFVTWFYGVYLYAKDGNWAGAMAALTLIPVGLYSGASGILHLLGKLL